MCKVSSLLCDFRRITKFLDVPKLFSSDTEVPVCESFVARVRKDFAETNKKSFISLSSRHNVKVFQN